jgi:hypothetical protein
MRSLTKIMMRISTGQKVMTLLWIPLMTLLDGSSSRDVPMDYSTDGSEEELGGNEDMDVYRNVVEDGKDSEAERVEGVGEHQIVM